MTASTHWKDAGPPRPAPCAALCRAIIQASAHPPVPPCPNRPPTPPQVLGVIPAGLRFTPNKAEVEHVFTAPLRMFLEAGPGYWCRDEEWEPGIPYRCLSVAHKGGHEGAGGDVRLPGVEWR